MVLLVRVPNDTAAIESGVVTIVVEVAIEGVVAVDSVVTAVDGVVAALDGVIAVLDGVVAAVNGVVAAVDGVVTTDDIVVAEDIAEAVVAVPFPSQPPKIRQSIAPMLYGRCFSWISGMRSLLSSLLK